MTIYEKAELIKRLIKLLNESEEEFNEEDYIELPIKIKFKKSDLDEIFK